MTSGYMALNRDQKTAIRAFVQEENKTLSDVAAAAQLKEITILKYCSDKNFLSVLSTVREVFNFNQEQERIE